ncbi:alanyl-tRNA editing protein [Litchfieldia salsa]|uniref:Alanyl-tRNA synthetase n=1 Tax=Litchfieldia salsa TaxID=930152 RepID=A0A1H0STC3_9BACI|nr:alanyl-tRNA editing protein [Litchfieldia salsa]SDP45001.1 alanyl-tRNA synthetase [Litchfieldia salsa]
MTEKLYYTQPTTTEWNTTITRIIEREDFYLIELQETAFYPVGGGQPADKGLINNIEVLDVFEEDNEVFHKLEVKPDTLEVSCQIDWKRRFDHTQQHTGQHLLSAVIIEQFGYATKSFHLGTEYCTIDIDTVQLTDHEKSEIEQRVNHYIYQNEEIKTYYVTEDELSKLPLRKIPDVTEDIRIVEINGIDVSACCGTHVNHTGQLGMIRIVKMEKQKGMVRVYFKCGYRALQDYQESSNILNEISTHLSSNRESLRSKIEKLENENKALQKQVETLTDENDRHFASELIKAETSNVITYIFKDRTIKDVQRLSRQLTDQNYIVIFQSQLERKMLLAHNGSHHFHSGQYFKEHLKNFNGKGGGNALSAQASFEDIEDMNKFSLLAAKNILNSLNAV